MTRLPDSLTIRDAPGSHYLEEEEIKIQLPKHPIIQHGMLCYLHRSLYTCLSEPIMIMVVAIRPLHQECK